MKIFQFLRVSTKYLAIGRFTPRLQNSLYFCVFKYARTVKQKVWNEGENRERDWGETLDDLFEPPGLNELITVYGKETVGFFLSPHTLLRHTLPISLLILRKNDCFAVYLRPSVNPIETLIETPAGHLSGHFI